jgi:hypothetical protein
MADHAVFSPSSAARWLVCPPSATLSQGIPQRANAAAIEGTRVHGVIERALRQGIMPPQPLPWETQGRNMSDYEVAAYIRDYIEQLGGGVIQVEKKVWLTKGCWGHLDVGHLAIEMITVIDYKNGGWDVPAKDNKQLLTYAATFLDDNPQAQHFRLVIFQPNSWMNGTRPDEENGFKQYIHTRAEVEAHRKAVEQAIAYIGPPQPGPQCRWCPAFSTCPAMSTDAGFLVGALAHSPDMLKPEELLRMLRVIRGLADMRDALERELTDRLKAGASVHGAELKPVRKWQAWNDERQAAETLWRIAGAKGVKAVTPAAAKKLSHEAAQYADLASHKPEPEMKASY